MNILIVAEDFLLNGVTRHICDLANGLAEAGHMGIVAATPCEQAKRLNSQISFVPLFLCRPETDKKIFSGIVKSLRILITVIQQNHIDIIHTHKRYADILGRIAARMTGIKHISTCHNEFTSHRWLSLFGDRTIAPSEPIAHMLVDVFRLPEDHVKIVYHGIKPLNRQAPEALQRQRQVLGIESDVKIVLSVGHMNRQKDRTTLIEAIHLLHARHQFDNAVCLIVGEGDEYSKIQTLIHRYRLEAHIKVLPANSDIELLNNIADFCVVSSLYEAGPYVVLEAASLGKPSVGTAVGLIPSFMGNDEAGLCIAPGQPQQLADAMRSLLMNPERTVELGKKAFERFQQSFTYDRFIANTISVYEKLLPKK